MNSLHSSSSECKKIYCQKLFEFNDLYMTNILHDDHYNAELHGLGKEGLSGMSKKGLVEGYD